MALIVGISMLINTMAIQPHVLSYATNMSSAGLLAGTNAQREKNGLNDLTLNNQLTLAAQTKAQDMVNRDYWAHNTPDGQEPWVFINNAGYQYLAAGENLAYGFTTSDDAITGWMNSPGHKANILNTDYQEVGFGMANSTNFQSNGQETIVVAMYGKPAGAVVPASPTETAAPSQQTANEPAIAVEKSKDTNGGMKISAIVPATNSKKVSHIQLMTSGAAPWSLLVASSLAIGLLALLIGRHSLAWHKFLRRGEKFVLKHKFFDIVIVAAIMIAAILSQASGYIQ